MSFIITVIVSESIPRYFKKIQSQRNFLSPLGDRGSFVM